MCEIRLKRYCVKCRNPHTHSSCMDSSPNFLYSPNVCHFDRLFPLIEAVMNFIDSRRTTNLSLLFSIIVAVIHTTKGLSQKTHILRVKGYSFKKIFVSSNRVLALKLRWSSSRNMRFPWGKCSASSSASPDSVRMKKAISLR